MKTFSTAGPVKSDDHYNIPALSRWDTDEIYRLIEEKRYFVLHAPRQTGKTTCLFALMEKLNREDHYTALYVNVEPAQAMRGNVETGMRTILDAFVSSADQYLDDRFLLENIRKIVATYSAGSLLREGLRRWCQQLDKPLILLLDEVDSLVGDTLISLLRQIRAGYPDRPRGFPQTVLLCGVRDIRDYRIHTGDNEVITGGSAFNIKSKSLRLGNFSREEIADLYAQHTQETGQIFQADVVNYVFEQTAGQPWLVNALGYEACFDMARGRDRNRQITREIMIDARERLIERRDTHIDQLVDKLREPRVHQIISRMLADTPGEGITLPEDDLQYVEDLGLIRARPELVIANPIYREVIPRTLTWTTQVLISQETTWYLKDNGGIDMPKLLNGFQQFFRENSDIWLERFDYKEAGPQLLMQAFLQRIVNGGGRIDREYGLGRRRTDLLVQWPLDDTLSFHGPMQRAVIELKILHKSLEDTLTDGIHQTADYMDRVGTNEGYLIIFDRTPNKPWEEKIFVREEANKTEQGKYRIGVFGM
uniref:AAA domain-containing protein n=1 Tax=Candidatus Kentrum sp. MB TaxID=2138164 RepID=A0A450XRL9_9GAMM|nr:MAG: AAA domain-containing protein [Candidatus Kentron sp. MB]VFK31916.1 MAG: AAA domain-containing protein [Candidatus Kentron sp. MB]VFK76172.1 MAG: AAA domain-containing protein [Candidatus Kentron sp. MB]